MSEGDWAEPAAQKGESSSNSAGKDADWERDLLNRLAFASLNEQRRARRWGILFKILVFVYLFGLLFMARTDQWQSAAMVPSKHTALVEISGIIAPDSESSADNIVEGLRLAFEAKKSAGVILRINSPGGSPVQSAYINAEIKRLKEKYPDKPLYAVVSDVCASGGYYVAAAADKIFVNESSLIGSIGVRMDSFGFVEAIDKLGIERRLITAGENKGFLDPFLPAEEEEVEHVQGLLNEIHEQFIEVVREGRGERLSENPKLFSGLIWSGERGIELGLADEYGSASHVAREVIEAPDIVDYTPQADWLKRFSRRLGTAIGRGIAETLDVQGTQLR